MTPLRLGLHQLLNHTRLALAMALAVAIPLLVFFSLQAYQSGLISRYSTDPGDYLVVQSSGSLGEFYGSRLSAQVGEDLRAAGASRIIPEIHTVVGTTSEEAILLRGIDRESYFLAEEFQMKAGRPLFAGDAPRLAMIGARLAESRHLLPGDTISIRGRDFRVIGIFDVDTYIGNEAWVSLQDAQALLGWGTDVSVYVIPARESLKEGDTLPGGISVVKKGSSGASLLAEWESLFGLIKIVVVALGVAATTALASILWRLAWLQRRELAILRSLGFGKGSLAAYLLVQGSGITLLGFLSGGLAALVLGELNEIGAGGLTVEAVFNMKVTLVSLAFAAGITLAGTAVPVWWFNRLNLSVLLRSE